MSLTRTRLVDLDNTIDLGSGKTLQDLILDITNISVDGTDENTFSFGRAEAVIANTIQLTFGNYNTPDLPPTLKYDHNEESLLFSHDPTNVTYKSLAYYEQVTPALVHMSETTNAHGGFVSRLGAITADSDPIGSSLSGEIKLKESTFTSLEVDEGEGTISVNVTRSPRVVAKQLNGNTNSVEHTRTLELFTGTLVTSEMLASGDERIALPVPPGYQIPHVSLISWSPLMVVSDDGSDEESPNLLSAKIETHFVVENLDEVIVSGSDNAGFVFINNDVTSKIGRIKYQYWAEQVQ